MGASLKQKLAVAAFVLFCLIMGLVIGGQALSSRAKVSANPETEVQGSRAARDESQPSRLPDGPRVSQGIEPRGWVDLDRSCLEDFMSLPGMTRKRAVAIIEIRKQKPDLKPEDLLAVPGITQSDLDSWKPFLWERDEDSAASPGRS